MHVRLFNASLRSNINDLYDSEHLEEKLLSKPQKNLQKFFFLSWFAI